MTFSATIVAAIFGSTILMFGGWDWAATAAGSFLITAILSQHEERRTGTKTEIKKAPRNLKQMIANGILLSVLAILHGTGGENPLIVVAYLGSVGAVAGDTWATAAGLFSAKNPRLITTRQRVPAGTPGAVTDAGIALSGLAGLAASALYISTAAIVDSQAMSSTVHAVLCGAAIAGALAGSLLDSYLGAACQAVYVDASGRATEQSSDENGSENTYVRGWRWLTNDVINFSNAVTGALAASFVWLSAAWLDVL